MSNIKKTKLWKLARKVLGRNKPKAFRGSGDYWESRYKQQDNSGAGSYGRLAEFKAEVINGFVQENKVSKVLELGVGDGNQLSLARYPHFIGLDVSNTAINWCKEKFAHDTTKEFYLTSEVKPQEFGADLAMSLDVIYHLVEDVVFENYMADLFNSASRFVIVYSSNYDEHSAPHVRSRKFTNWIDANRRDWKLLKYIENRYPFDPGDPDHTSIADFYIYQKIT